MARNEHRCLKPQTHPALSPQNNYYLPNQKPFIPDNIWQNYFTPAFPSKNAFTSTDIFTTHKNSRAFRFSNNTHSIRINGKLQKEASWRFLKLEKGPQMAFSKASPFPVFSSIYLPAIPFCRWCKENLENF